MLRRVPRFCRRTAATAARPAADAVAAQLEGATAAGENAATAPETVAGDGGEPAEEVRTVVPQARPTFAITKASDMRPLMQIGNPEESASRRWLRRALLASAAGVATVVYWDVNDKVWSDLHSWRTALAQYLLFRALGCLGRRRLRQLLRDAEDGEAVQRRLLGELLARHQSTEYGRERGLLGVTSLEEFRATHPLTRHADYADYVAAVSRHGRENVLAPGLPRLLAMTSGTSGRPNLIPHTEDVSKNFFLRGVCVAFAVLEANYPGAADQLQRSSKLCFRPSRSRTSGGLEVGSNSSSPDDRSFQRSLCAYTSPLAAYEIEHEPDALYAHALFALKDRNLGMLEANFAPLLCLLLDTAREHRRSLVQDLRNGHIWDRHTFESAPAPPELRARLDEALGGPDPKRAAEVDALLRAGAPAVALWPRLRCAMTTDGGAFRPAAARLRELLGDGVDIYSPFYAATEGLLGVNITPDRPFGVSTYVLDPGSMVFELLPAAWRDTEQPPCDATVLPWQAQVGQTYEIVITTRGGLCRYRLGDIVRVHGLFGQMPVVSVEERATHVLPSLHGERIAEGVFLAALASCPLARRLKGAVVVDAPLAADSSRLHVFAELAGEGEAGAVELAAQLATQLDGALCASHEVYASFRRKEAIRQLQVHWVDPGTFRALRGMMASRGQAAEPDGDARLPAVGGGQVKIPTVLRGDLAERILRAERTLPPPVSRGAAPERRRRGIWASG